MKDKTESLPSVSQHAKRDYNQLYSAYQVTHFPTCPLAGTGQALGVGARSLARNWTCGANELPRPEKIVEKHRTISTSSGMALIAESSTARNRQPTPAGAGEGAHALSQCGSISDL